MSKQGSMKRHPAGFREKAVQMARVSGRRPREIAEEFGMSSDSVRRWAKQADSDEGRRACQISGVWVATAAHRQEGFRTGGDREASGDHIARAAR